MSLNKEKPEKQDKARETNIQEFLSELSVLTNRYGLKIQKCEDCAGPLLYDFKGHKLHQHFKYNKGTGSYILVAGSTNKNEDKRMTEGEFLNYVKQQNIKCGFGWYGLIMPILSVIFGQNINHPDKQIKIKRFEEKQGTLHIVVTEWYSDILKDWFDITRKASANICEYCGCIGELKKCNDGIIKTLCPECRKKYKRRRKYKKPDDEIFELMKEQIIDCRYGWYGLFFPIIAIFKEWNDKHPEWKERRIFHFGEKWGQLNYYYSFPSILKEPVNNAREASAKICEMCGGLGEFIEDGFGEFHTLCPDCTKVQEKLDCYFKEELEKKFGTHSERGQIFSRWEHIEEIMPEFLSELSALSQKYELSIIGNNECDCSLSISDIEYWPEYSDLEYNYDTGRYTVEGFGQNGNNEEPEGLKEA